MQNFHFLLAVKIDVCIVFFFCFVFSKSVCIKSQAFRQSSKEYQAVREKYAAQRKEIEEGLSK